MADQDCVAFVNIGGVDYEAREHKYSATVLKLADTFSITIPAPDGKVRGLDGSQTPIANVATMGARVTLAMSDPNVRGGERVTKLRGIVAGRRMQTDRDGGTTLAVTGADLGWMFSSCGRVFQNLRGLTWLEFLKKVCGLTVDPVTGSVVADAFGWGIQGVRQTNVINRKLRLGRQVVESDFQRAAAAKTSLLVPRFQIEVGETIDQRMIQLAKIDHFLVNVSTDGFLQIFQPDYSQAPLYSFFRYPTTDTRRKQNNIIDPSVEESGDSLYTRVQCWSSVVDTTNKDPTNPNAGRYYGKFENTSTLPFQRLYTFTDPEQMGQDRVTSRARWQWQRFLFDSWTYSFETVGHSQNGVPFVEDTMCELHDLLYGYEGVFYVAGVEPSRKLARPGFDRGSGSRCRITLKKPNLLAA